MTSGAAMSDLDFDAAHRELCPDGACIGVIGPDGRCRVCGAVGASATTHPRNAGLQPEGDDDDGGPDPGVESAAGTRRDPLEPAPDDFDDRQLCPDGACLGVIAAGGRCTVCGRSG
jgi:hypothetical protein